MGKFQDSVKKQTDRVKAELDLSIKNGVILFFSAIVYDTPVDEGGLRGDWLVSIDEPRHEVTGRLSLTGDEAVQEIQQTVQAGHVNHLYNSLPYVAVVEYGLYPNPPKKVTGKTINGFSSQAPAGMLSVNIARWETYLKVGAEAAKSA